MRGDAGSSCSTPCSTWRRSSGICFYSAVISAIRTFSGGLHNVLL